jgi:hypothetical protein
VRILQVEEAEQKLASLREQNSTMSGEKFTMEGQIER